MMWQFLRLSINKVKDWVSTLREIVDQNIIFVIAGNKLDICDKKLLDKNEEIINGCCQKENCKRFCTSAKTGCDVGDAFDCLIKKVLDKIEKNPSVGNAKKKGRRLEISAREDKTNQKQKGCCK